MDISAGAAVVQLQDMVHVMLVSVVQATGRETTAPTYAAALPGHCCPC
jgi:hypothetical protein